ncbi:MAG: bifunctional folylpolyglutamate synthase/dihydrofolate synthase [Bacteroidales bacterium]|nr:bifunctional folylpolyglutamate synthase/dihydrofolate synthase [Bacteroidales bacterium]
MNYNEALSYLLNQLPMYQRIGRAAYKSGLENTYRLDAYFGSPHRNFRTIHVAGTNGKGSVSHMLASVLQQSGYKVGLYTSPHLLDFRERIKINGKSISKKDVTEFVNHHKEFFDTLQVSFFEISVFMAFHFYHVRQVDVAVVEVGLGGRLDSTNIIIPEVSVITNIGKDHTELLGITFAKIAREKAGIIKSGVPVVIGESKKETRLIFKQLAEAVHAPIIFADVQYKVDSSFIASDRYQVFNIKKGDVMYYHDLRCGLLGRYQQKNIITVLAALEVLNETGFYIPEKEIYNGISQVIKNTGLYGRWQVFSEKPAIICDTAHNTEGIQMVMQQIAGMPARKVHIIIGFVSDKNLRFIFRFLPSDAEYYFTRLSVPRTMDEKKLKDRALKQGLHGRDFSSVAEAFEAAGRESGPDDIILITGSTFCVADFLSVYSKKTIDPEHKSEAFQ